jgi:hypothetical protein
MNHFARIAASLGVFGVAAGFAYGQGTDPINITLRFGYFFPANAEARNLDKQWLTFGIEYEFLKLRSNAIGTERPAALSLSVDAYSRSQQRSTLQAVPVLINYVGDMGDFFYSVGVGAASATRTGFRNSVDFAYQVSVGYMFSKSQVPLLAAVRWYSVANIGSRLDGFAITVGVKF